MKTSGEKKQMQQKSKKKARKAAKKQQRRLQQPSRTASCGEVHVPCFRRLDDALSFGEGEEVPEENAGAAMPSVAVSRYSLAATEGPVAPLPGWTEQRGWIIHEEEARAAFDAAALSQSRLDYSYKLQLQYGLASASRSQHQPQMRSRRWGTIPRSIAPKTHRRFL